LWQEIAQILKMHGYTNINEDILDRKMRNMKRSYKTIKENNKKTSTGRGRVSSEYYNIFENIFADDKTINPDNTLESTINVQETLDACQSTTESISENENSSTSTASTSTAQSLNPLSDLTNFNPVLEPCLDSPSTSNTSLINSSNHNSTSPSMPKKKSLYNQRKKQLEIEQKRVQAIIDLKESLEESNKIQRERNNLIQQLLQSQLRQ